VRPDGATWRSGYAPVCKTVYTSSILVVASNKINDLGESHKRRFFFVSISSVKLGGAATATSPL
jgi:hypothetical protein